VEQISKTTRKAWTSQLIFVKNLKILDFYHYDTHLNSATAN